MNKNFIPFLFLITAGTLFAAETHAHSENCAEHNHREKAENQAAHEEHDHDHEHDSDHEHDRDHDSENSECHDDHGNAPLADCDEHDHAETEHDGAEQPVVITISDRARESIAMRREKISTTTLADIRSYYGKIIVPASAIKTAAIPAAGRVKFFVKVGENVKVGDPLFSLSSPALIEMQSNVRDAESAVERANTELKTLRERLAKLEAIGLKNSELESSIQFKLAEIKTLGKAAERYVDLWNQATQGEIFSDGVLTVPARYNGTIQSLEMNEGAWGDQGASALTYIASSSLEFKGAIYGNDVLAGTSARLAITIKDETKYFAGTLRIATQISEDSQTRTVYFHPENLPADVFAGQVARLEIFTPEKLGKNIVLVPSSAVIKVGIDNIVFVCDAVDKNKFTAVKVKTLRSRRGMTALSGVPANATIVTKGGYELKYVLPNSTGTQKKTAGHFHADGKFHEGEH